MGIITKEKGADEKASHGPGSLHGRFTSACKQATYSIRILNMPNCLLSLSDN